ncbi:MAG: PBSX family phage terminase large subunit [Endomicrobium sp.]|jgi:PBSX family phage terminase large subunit|nr:PBSX family phage terminase large subunit [Endomicrobium sp.]
MIDLKVSIPQAYDFLFDNTKLYKFCSGGRGSAKTWSFLTYLIIEALDAKNEILIARKTEKSIKRSVNKELVNAIERLGVLKYCQIQSDRILFVNGSEISYTGLKNVDELRSARFNKLLIEEAHNITENDIDVIVPTLMRHKNPEFLAIWNKQTDNDSINKFVEANKNRDDFVYRHTTFADNPFLPEKLETERQNCLKNEPEKYAWIWLGAPMPEGEEAQFIRTDVIKEAQAREMPDNENYPLILGVDPKREGKDDFVVVARKGKKAWLVWQTDKYVDTQFAISKLAEIINDMNPLYVFIDSGKGEGITDFLRAQYANKIYEVKFAMSPNKPDIYRNKRAEMYGLCRTWLQEGGSLPANPFWLIDLASARYAPDKDGKILLEPKEKIKGRIGRSPGYADALVLTFALGQNVVKYNNANSNNFIIKRNNSFLDR